MPENPMNNHEESETAIMVGPEIDALGRKDGRRMEERYDVVVEEAVPAKAPEDLLPNGTVVYLNREAERTPRVILWSLPDDHYPHRYRVDGTFGVCVTRDFTVAHLPTPEEKAFYDQQNEERHRAFDGIARWLETSRESREGAGDNGAVSQETGDR